MKSSKELLKEHGRAIARAVVNLQDQRRKNMARTRERAAQEIKNAAEQEMFK